MIAEKPVLGAVVTWSSQSQGYSATKMGVVVEVVPIGASPSRERFPSLYSGAGVGFPRKVESYVVECFTNAEKRTGRKLYWPLPRRLKIVAADR